MTWNECAPCRRDQHERCPTTAPPVLAGGEDTECLCWLADHYGLLDAPVDLDWLDVDHHRADARQRRYERSVGW